MTGPRTQRYSDEMASTDRILRSAGVAAATLFIVTGGVFAGRAIVEAPGATPAHDDSSEYESAEGSPMPTLDVDELLSPLPSAQADVVDDDFLAGATASPEASDSPDATQGPDATASAEATEGADATAEATASPDDDATAEPTESFDDHGGNSGPGSPNSGSDDDDDDSDSGNSGPGSPNSGRGSDDDDDDNSGSGSDDDDDDDSSGSGSGDDDDNSGSGSDD